MAINISEPVQRGDKNFVGIDFGTTNSLVGIFKDGGVHIVPDSCGDFILPSVVAFNEGNFIVGQSAKQCQDAIFSIKRLLGKNLESFATLYPQLKVSSASNISVSVDGKDINVVEIASHIFRNLKLRAEQRSKSAVRSAVVTVPAYFDDSSRSAIKNSARLAGIEEVRLLSEPTAAAFFYGMDKKKQHGKYLVYDLGGGTFDVSILEFHKGIFRVITTDGNDVLGGDDFDRLIVDYFKKEHNLGNVECEGAVQLMVLARKIKEDLSEGTSARGSIEINGETYRLTLNISQFNSLIAPYIDKTIEILLGALKRSGNTPKDIDGVLLVGGSTRIKIIRERLNKIFDSKKVFDDLNPDTIVASGATLYASFLNGQNTGRMLLVDVLPLSLGIETIGGATERIISKDSAIPIMQSQTFTNFIDYQTSFKINVVQGEREFVKDNRSLAEFELKNIPPLPAGKARIEVTFSVDENGILTVSAKELTLGIIQIVEVNPTYGLSPEKIDAMLIESFENLATDRDAKLLLDAKNYAEKICKIISNAITTNPDLLDNNTKKEIEIGLHLLESSLSGQDCDNISRTTEMVENTARDFLQRRLNFLINKMNLSVL